MGFFEQYLQIFQHFVARLNGEGGGESVTVEALTAHYAGTYTAPAGTAYSPVAVSNSFEPSPSSGYTRYEDCFLTSTDFSTVKQNATSTIKVATSCGVTNGERVALYGDILTNISVLKQAACVWGVVSRVQSYSSYKLVTMMVHGVTVRSTQDITKSVTGYGTHSTTGTTSITVNPYLESKSETITENGTYTYTASGYDGMSQVEITVDVPTGGGGGGGGNVQEYLDINTDGDYTPSSGYDGIKEVTVNTGQGSQATLMGQYVRVPLDVEATGTYYPNPGICFRDAFVEVTKFPSSADDLVLVELYVHGDGTYAAGEGYAFSAVHVDCGQYSSYEPLTVEPLSVTANGEYTAESGYGYGEVTVNVSGGGGGGDTIADMLEGNLQTYENTTTTLIPDSAFMSNPLINDMIFHAATEIGSRAFMGSSLTSIEAPLSETIGAGAFQNCASLESAKLPLITSVPSDAFFYATSLEAISGLENVSSIGDNAFAGTALEFVETSAQTIGLFAFSGCSSLTKVIMPNVRSIAGFAFGDCTSLEEIVIGQQTDTSICTLSGTNAFSNVPSTCLIYVPDDLLEDYQNDSVWSNFYNQLTILSDYDPGA